MELNELSNNIINTLKNKDIESVEKYMIFPNNNNITDRVRDSFKSMSKAEIKEIQKFLYRILDSCYEGKILNENYTKLENIDEDERFLLKENVIYYLISIIHI